jgi:hypothetical protein
MKSKWIDSKFIYDGQQLRPLYGYMEHGILGDSIVAWRGGCNIPFENIVDGEDRRSNSQICGEDMIHFIVELFECDLLAAVGVQRLIGAITKDALVEESPELAPRFLREGDDIYFLSEVGEKMKFSISIATKSPTSAMIHFAFNVTNDGTPVPTSSLTDFDIEADDFSRRLLSRIASEVGSMRDACRKVFPIS